MPVVDQLTAVLPLSICAISAAALLVFIAAFVLLRDECHPFLTVVGGISLMLAGALVVWTAFDWAVVRDRAAERRVMKSRIAELATRAFAPASPLACLDGLAGDAVEAACEKAVFAGPETVAAAVSYMAAHLALLADGKAHDAGGGYDAALTPTLLAVETDRFGIVAHILAVRDGCTAQQCDTLALLRDRSRVETNLREQTFESYVNRHVAGWSTGASSTHPEAAGPPAAAAAGATPTPGVPLSSRYDFPSAASIPPVSIMNAEPAGPAAGPPAPAAQPAARAPVPRQPPPRSAPRAATSNPTPAAAGGSSQPVQLVPPNPPPSR